MEIVVLGKSNKVYAQFRSVQSLSHVWLCNLMDCSVQGLPVHHQLSELAQTHPLSRWCLPTISSSVIPFSSYLQFFSALFVKEAILCPYIFLAPLTKIVALLLSHVRLFVTPWTAAHQASLSFTISQSLLKFTSIESVMPSNHLILCHPLLLLPSIFPSIRVFSNELALHIRWPEYWNFSFSIGPSGEPSRLISFRIDQFDV